MSGKSRPETPDDALESIFYQAERVRFIHTDQFSGAKATVGLVMLITILSFITGLSMLSRTTVPLEGPLGPIVPGAEVIVRFGGVFTSFGLGGIAVGLIRRKRLAWFSALVALPLLAAFPLFTLDSTHLPLTLLALGAVPLLVRNRNQFRTSLDLNSLQIAALSSIVGVLAYGTIGSYAIRDQFGNINTWSDAFYFVLVTIATVGYGDITPSTTQAKWFALSVIIFGAGAFTTAIGALIVPAIEKRMANAFGNMTPSSLALLEDHVIVLGYGDITGPILEELADTVDVVVVTPDSDVASRLDDADVNVLTGDPTDGETLAQAGAEYARGAIVATEDDAQDVLAILAMREVNPDIRIVGAAHEAQHADKLRNVGADRVISPTVIGGRLLGRSVLDEDGADTADLAMVDEEPTDGNPT